MAEGRDVDVADGLKVTRCDQQRLCIEVFDTELILDAALIAVVDAVALLHKKVNDRDQRDRRGKRMQSIDKVIC